MRLPRSGLALLLVCALAVGCSETAPPSAEPSQPSGPSERHSHSESETTDPTGPARPDRTRKPRQRQGLQQPWGPNASEIERAGRLVAQLDTPELAGQVIVARYDGTDPASAAALVRDHHFAGVSVGSSNVVDEAQVRATTAAVTAAHAATGRDWPPVIGVDEEGGIVSHLGDVATEFPPFATAGRAIASQGNQGERIVAEAARATALELRDLGFTWVFAPVADVTIGAADPTIGSRSPSGNPALAARAVAAAVGGYNDGGLVSTTKHFPGHGGVTADSHESLPVLRSSLQQLRDRDLRPFEAAVGAGAPAIMMAHIDVRALQARLPSSQSPAVYDFLREELGFDGVTITDSLGMGAALTESFPAIRALAAGADLLLMPVDAANTHQLVIDAIESGRLPRSRVEQAATRVVALQLWQARVADGVPVPADVAERGRRAAAALAAAGS